MVKNYKKMKIDALDVRRVLMDQVTHVGYEVMNNFPILVGKVHGGNSCSSDVF